MTTKDEIKNRISMALKSPVLQQGFEIICRENDELEKENAELKADNDARKFAMFMSENVEKKLREQIEKMKCCENCKYNSYWGNELHCNYGLKEALQEDKLVECNKMDKWEIKENAN